MKTALLLAATIALALAYDHFTSSAIDAQQTQLLTLEQDAELLRLQLGDQQRAINELEASVRGLDDAHAEHTGMLNLLFGGVRQCMERR